MGITDSHKLLKLFKENEAKFYYSEEEFKEFCQKILEREGIAALPPEIQIELLIKEVNGATKKSISEICVPRDTFAKAQRYARKLFPTAIPP